MASGSGGDGEIFVVTSIGQGHLFPCMELCKRIASRNYRTTLVIPSNLSSSVPSSFLQHSLVSLAEIAPATGMKTLASDAVRQKMGLDLEAHLTRRSMGPDPHPLLCAVIDFQMGWTKEVFRKFSVPVVGFFTFGACAAAMEWGAWKTVAGNIAPGEVRTIPGLPGMALSLSDLKRRPGGPPPGAEGPKPPGGGGPLKPGDRPPWVGEIEGSSALIFNTCDGLERPFIEYMADQLDLPVWGVGPLLPEQYWKSSDSPIRDREMRTQKRPSNYSEEEVIQWLDTKPRGSVLYVSFGSELGPTTEECSEIAAALEESTRPFIWVIQPDWGRSQPPGAGRSESEGGYQYHPHGLEKKVGERGMIICGWAPQLLILSHPSTGGFLSHCGWNSTAEAIGQGVPLLAWPIRGDQYYNAKLVAEHLKIGHMALGDPSGMGKKEDILSGVERMMGDEEVRQRAAELRAKFIHGFPTSSDAALDAFLGFFRPNASYSQTLN
ncbi:mogroside IE synthase-like [Malania oleifera]|uniref:mogroside IE synthase-like n=1 Tax=Malania oleifera TaxID=397392 RepID=UPI0025AEB948|nr:mogroside IE synthase-like [Malania oleifera]